MSSVNLYWCHKKFMHTIRFDPANTLVSAALRRAVPRFLNDPEIHYDPWRRAGLNDLFFGEIVQVPAFNSYPLQSNILETVKSHDNTLILRREIFHPGPCVGVIGNRYAPPYMIGGLEHPITRKSNGVIQGGSVVNSLAGLGPVGIVNDKNEFCDEVLIKVHGVLTDKQGRSMNLNQFTETLPEPDVQIHSKPFIIVAAGYSTDSGKTTCACALSAELRQRGYKVTAEKKTGTTSCKDLFNLFSESGEDFHTTWDNDVPYNPASFLARDFVDGLGIISDVSMDPQRFVSSSIQYTRKLLSYWQPDIHIIELADGLAHVSNVALMSSDFFRQHVDFFIYCSSPTHEAVSHFSTYLREVIKYSGTFIVSGPLANESCYSMARQEVEERTRVPVIRSARLDDGLWMPEGQELAAAVEKEMLSR